MDFISNIITVGSGPTPILTREDDLTFDSLSLSNCSYISIGSVPTPISTNEDAFNSVPTPISTKEDALNFDSFS